MAEQVNIGAYEPATAKMILEVVRYLKKNGYLLQAGQRGQANFDAPRLHIAYTTETITARTGTTAGKGKATLKYIPGEPGTAEEIEDFADASEIDVYNVAGSEVTTGKYIYVAREYGSGKWVIVLEDCGA
jgi:hypothetical protein